MAKKSNKTEHVLKLITKDDDTTDNFVEKEEPMVEKEQPRVELSVKSSEEKELKYETKMKIEIEPEIKIKSMDHVEKTITINPQSNSESALMEKHGNLINVAEILANEKLELVMSRMNVCTCPVCVNDVMALALNLLPTKYVTTDAGKQYMQLDMYKKQYETDILAALTKACVRVKASPRHE